MLSFHVTCRPFLLDSIHRFHQIIFLTLKLITNLLQDDSNMHTLKSDRKGLPFFHPSALVLIGEQSRSLYFHVLQEMY